MSNAPPSTFDMLPGLSSQPLLPAPSPPVANYAPGAAPDHRSAPSSFQCNLLSGAADWRMGTLRTEPWPPIDVTAAMSSGPGVGLKEAQLADCPSLPPSPAASSLPLPPANLNSNGLYPTSGFTQSSLPSSVLESPSFPPASDPMPADTAGEPTTPAALTSIYACDWHTQNQESLLPVCLIPSLLLDGLAVY